MVGRDSLGISSTCSTRRFKRTSKAVLIAFWILTALFCVEMVFTAYWEWYIPQAAQAFARLGFSAASFRVELSIAKKLGVSALLIPAIHVRVKEWAYAGLLSTLFRL